MNQQQRIELQATVLQMVDSFMVNNQISASDMEDALNKVMVQLKDRILSNVLVEIYQEKAAQEEAVDETKE
jgi:hypothetical protein